MMTTKSETESVLVDFQPMSPEEMQRTMQCLLQQQAQFAASLDSLSGKTDRLADGVIGLTAIVGQLIVSQQETDKQLKETDKQLKETDRQLKDTQARSAEADARLTEQMRETESHLNMLIEMFERRHREDEGPRPS